MMNYQNSLSQYPTPVAGKSVNQALISDPQGLQIRPSLGDKEEFLIFEDHNAKLNGSSDHSSQRNEPPII